MASTDSFSRRAAAVHQRISDTLEHLQMGHDRSAQSELQTAIHEAKRLAEDLEAAENPDPGPQPPTDEVL